MYLLLCHACYFVKISFSCSCWYRKVVVKWGSMLTTYFCNMTNTTPSLPYCYFVRLVVSTIKKKWHRLRAAQHPAVSYHLHLHAPPLFIPLISFELAISENNKDTAAVWLRSSKDPNSCQFLHRACEKNHIDMANLLLKYGAWVANVDFNKHETCSLA